VSCGHTLFSAQNKSLVGSFEGTVLALINLSGNTPYQWARHVVLNYWPKYAYKAVGYFLFVCLCFEILLSQCEALPASFFLCA